MRQVLMLVALAAAAAGCATHARTASEGSALPRQAATADPVLREATLPDESDRARQRSVREFMTPRALLY